MAVTAPSGHWQLDLMVVVPLVFAVLALIVSRYEASAPRWLGLASALGQWALLLSLSASGVLTGRALVGLDASRTAGAWQVAIDGLSLPLVVLTLFIGTIAVVASWQVRQRPGTYFALLLALQSAVTGVFLAQSILLFYVAWECVLIPMFFLIGGWGSSDRRHAATKFLIFTFAAGGVMLAGVILAIVESGGQTSLQALAASPGRAGLSAWVFWLLVIGFLVKLPAVPLHSWLPDAHTEAPTAGSIVLAGVMLKMGGYGMMRVAMPLAPAAFAHARTALAVLGIVGIVYGAAMALVQTDLKRLVAYSSVSHMGFVLLALAAGTQEALGAAMLVMVSHGFVAGLLFLLVGALYERTHSRELGDVGGLGATMPAWSVAFVFGSLASLGLPGLSGFPGEFGAVLGSYSALGAWTLTAMVGLVLAAAYNLRAVRETVQGAGHGAERPADLTGRELLLAAGFSAGIVMLGVQPHVMLAPMETVLKALSALVGGGV